jgi:hypothetical protein
MAIDNAHSRNKLRDPDPAVTRANLRQYEADKRRREGQRPSEAELLRIADNDPERYVRLCEAGRIPDHLNPLLTTKRNPHD